MKRFWFGILRLSLQGRLRIHGEEHLPQDGPYIVAANHQGFLDAPLLSLNIWSRSRQAPVFPTTPWVWKIFRRFLGMSVVRYLGMLPIDESRPGGAVDAADAHLSKQGIIAIFPEGKRNTKPMMVNGKTGTVRMALHCGVPVIPAGIVSSHGGMLNAIWHVISRKPSSITYGAPLRFTPPAGELTRQQLHAMTDECMRAIAQLCGKEYRRT